jgi:hypothetical protein
VTATPPFIAFSCDSKKARVPEPGCGIFGAIVPLVPPMSAQLVMSPL